MSFFDAALLGAVQGLTEFLPVSSSGHLVIMQQLLGVGEVSFFFDVAVHGATLGAVLVYFRRDVAMLLRSLAGKGGSVERDIPCADVRSLWLSLIIGTLPAVLIGLAFHNRFMELFSSRQAAPLSLLLTGLFLILTRVKRRGEDVVSLRTAFIVGLAQAFAIVPGVSRSGWTIGAAIFAGVERRKAVQFSFLLSIPAVAGASLYELVGGSAVTARGLAVPILLGVAAAFVAGVVAIHALFSLSRRGRLELFGIYCLFAGALSLWLLS